MRPGLFIASLGLLTVVLIAACGTLEVGIERTPTLDHAATVAALATENARLKALLATVQATPASAGRVSPTPGATSTPGPIFATGFKAIAGSPPGTRLNQLLHEYEGISLGNWSPDGTHLVLYTPVGPLEGNQIPDAEPMIVDVESGVAWRTGDSGPYPYGDRFTWLPDGSVLFVAGGELWRAQADGQDRRLLTEAVADAIIAFSLSPDGSTVLAQGERQYWLVLTDGGVSQTVTDLPGGSGGRSWSPDGTRIALWHKDGTTYLIDPASATAHPLAETPVVGGWLVPPVWLANSQLFLNAPVYPHNRPALVDIESGAVRDLVSTLGLPEPEHVISQYYPSPDGKYMAITVADLDKFANMKYLWNIVTDELTEVGPPVDVFGGLWSPTGQQVVVLLGEGDEEILAVLDVSSSEVRRLAEPAWPPTEWAPDSTRIAFGSPEGDIWIVPADGSGEAKRLLPSLSENPTLQWSSDGQRLAVAVEHHFGPFHEELYVVKLASVTEETPALAVPEGQLAVLIGGPPLSLVNLAGRPPQTLGAGNIATYGALFFQWSPDGREIVYSADADLWLLDVESGESQNLTDNDRWDLMPAWSPDGDWIAFTSRPLLPDEGKADWMKGEWGGALAVIGANGAHFRILGDEGNVISPPSWAPTGRRLAYAADGELRLYEKALPRLRKLVQETGQAVYLARLQAGQVVIIESIQPPNAGPSLYWSPGQVAPVHCTAMGKILLSDLPRADLEQQLQPLTLTEPPAAPLDFVLATTTEQLSVIPASRELAGAEVELIPLPAREFRLKTVLDLLRPHFDTILIDSPPSLSLLTLNALVAADRVLIPLHCEYFALEGLADLVGTMRRVRSNLNQTLDVEGVLLTMNDDRTNLGQQVARDVREFFREKVYHTVIPRNVRLAEAPSHGVPVTVYDPKSRGAEAYMALASEFLQRRQAVS